MVLWIYLIFFLCLRFGSNDTNGEDTTSSSSSSSSEEEKEADSAESFTVNGHANLKDQTPASPVVQINGFKPHQAEQDEAEMEESNGLPTIYFSHTVEPKKVRSLLAIFSSSIMQSRLETSLCRVVVF